MVKSIILAAAVGAVLSASAFAQTSPSAPSNSPAATCDEKTFMMVKSDIDKMSDQTMKMAAMKDYEMAQVSMKDKKMAECVTQLDKARTGAQKR